MDFIHLHCHSHYSLLDGLSKPKDMVERACGCKMPGMALTDHGVMYGSIEFYKSCKEGGIKPIIGCEVYVARNGHKLKRPRIDVKPYHLVLLAKDYEGYQNLMRLTSIAHLEGFYYKPRIDLELLKKYSKGIIALSACLAGELAQTILNKGKDEAIAVIRKYQSIVGVENYYLEVQDHPSIPEQGKLNEVVIELAQELNIPLVATNDSHYVNATDANAHDILLCIQTNKLVSDTNRMSMIAEDFSLLGAEKMAESFTAVPEAISNTVRIAEQCNVEIPFGQNLIPAFEVPKEKTESEYLRELCFEGLRERYGIIVSDITNTQEASVSIEGDFELPDTAEAIVERLDFELKVVDNMGFPGYFLIVWDFIRYAREIGVFVGPGRGSAAGALLSYCIRITDIDPLKYGLLFERFLNPDRISMPDIDIDFEDERREEVIQYVQDKYGADRVCQIVTFGTMAARAAVKDVGRVYGESFAHMNELASKIPPKPGTKLKDALEEEAELREIFESNGPEHDILDKARALEGTVRQAGVHACAVIISNDVLTNYVPLQPAPGVDGHIISQYSMGPLEDLGLLKMDFLGLRNLSILRKALENIKQRHNVALDLNNISLEDAKTFDLFSQGKTIGVFQFESSGMRKYLQGLKPSVFEDIIAMVALYRPGPMQFIESFINRKHGHEEISYEHPLMEKALKDTYGITVYQEQVMQLSKDMASFTGGQADTLRKAIGKKKADLMAQMKGEFIVGCKGNNISEEIANSVWKTWEAFAQYCFNKSHAACYALIAYQTAYLKSQYPAEFMAALMTADRDNLDRLTIDIEECLKLGIEVLPPNINESFQTFTVVSDTQIRFGLAAIKNVGAHFVDVVLEERVKNGEFVSLDDFVTRVQDKSFNRKNLESLAKSGAFDDFEERTQIIENVETILNYAKGQHKAAAAGQESLFGSPAANKAQGSNLMGLRLAKVEPIPQKEQLAWEKDLLGVYITEHPFGGVQKQIAHLVTSIPLLQSREPNTKVNVAGIITSAKQITTKKGDPMMFLQIADTNGDCEVIVFPRTFKKFKFLLTEDKSILVHGNVNDKDDIKKVIADDFLRLETEEDIARAIKDEKKLAEKSGQPIAINRYAQGGSFSQSQKQATPLQKSHAPEETQLPNRMPAVTTAVNKLIVSIRYPMPTQLSAKLKEIFSSYSGEKPVCLKFFTAKDSKTIQTSYKVHDSADFRQALSECQGVEQLQWQ